MPPDEQISIKLEHTTTTKMIFFQLHYLLEKTMKIIDILKNQQCLLEYSSVNKDNQNNNHQHYNDNYYGYSNNGTNFSSDSNKRNNSNYCEHHQELNTIEKLLSYAISSLVKTGVLLAQIENCRRN